MHGVIKVNYFNWQLDEPLDAILFDCDGTLSAIEGIDALALSAGEEIAHAVKVLTAEAMTQTGINPEVFQKRLELVRPIKKQMLQLGDDYFQQRSPESQEVITLLRALGKPIYILSAGLLPAVARFAELLQIPSANIFAVDIQFDEQGNYLDFDRSSPLIHNHGKRIIAEQLKMQHSHLLYMGDGLNDLAVRELVTRFIGYGGTYYRQNIADQSDFYITHSSLLPLLPLALTAQEADQLTTNQRELYEKGLVMLQEEDKVIKQA